MQNFVKRMFHSASFLVSGVLSQRKQPPSRRKGIYVLPFSFSWVRFSELHSWKTEFMVIVVRQLELSRVTMNFFLISAMFMQNTYIAQFKGPKTQGSDI